ncbi:MAG: hypothetical protein SWY16_11225 [Cyanobacteriota bacterium]|nr:hypothetical protein [Cyanobacteriota bacterium]
MVWEIWAAIVFHMSLGWVLRTRSILSEFGLGRGIGVHHKGTKDTKLEEEGGMGEEMTRGRGDAGTRRGEDGDWCWIGLKKELRSENVALSCGWLAVSN